MPVQPSVQPKDEWFEPAAQTAVQRLDLIAILDENSLAPGIRLYHGEQRILHYESLSAHPAECSYLSIALS